MSATNTKVLVVISRGDTAVVEQGYPPTQTSAYYLDVPEGGNPIAVAGEWASENNFPIGSIAKIITDMSTVETFQLQSQWVQL